MWWPVTLTYICKIIRPWLWKSYPLCNVFSSRSTIFFTLDPIWLNSVGNHEAAGGILRTHRSCFVRDLQGIQGRQQERIFLPHGLMVEQVEISGQALWSGAGYLLHITTTAVQHNRDDMSVLCLINNGHDIHLYPYHSTFCRWPISSMSRSAMLPWSVWSSSAPIYFLRHGFEHVGSRYKIFTVCCHLIIVLAEAVFAIEIPWNTKTVAASRVHRIASLFEQNVFPPMPSQGLTNGGACFSLSRPWPQFQNIVFVYWQIEHVPDSDLSSHINDN